MNIPRLCINQVYRFDQETDAPKDERILWIDDATGMAAMIGVINHRASLHFVDCRYLEERLMNGTVIPTADPYRYLMMPDESYGETRLRERDFNAAAMDILTNAPPEILFDRTERGKLIQQISDRDHSDRTRRNRKTVFDLLRRFWQRGQMVNAFLTDRHLGGWHREKREADPIKQQIAQRRKSPATGQPKTNFTMTKENERLLYRIGHLYWRTRKPNGKKRSWPEAMQYGYERFFATGWKMVNGIRTPILPSRRDLPTVEQLKRAYYKVANIEEVTRKREGERKYNLRCRPLKGDQRQIAWGPMHLVQMDTQKIKLYVVHKRTRKVIGRPSGTMSHDTMSRLITAFSLTIGSERAMQYKLTYLHMAEDKVEFCKRYGIGITADEWPCCDLPAGCLVDNGSGNTAAFRGIHSALGTRFYNTGGSRPEMKPIVESGFDDFNEKAIFQLPGAVLTESEDPDADPATRRYIEQASLDMDKLTQIFIYYILDYNQRVLEGYPLTDAMKGRVAPIPIALWKWGLQRRTGVLTPKPIELIRLHCLSKGTARVTPNGIMFEGKAYDCDRAIKEGWQTRARMNGTWSIPILYDERNLANIYYDLKNRTNDGPYYEVCHRIRAHGENVNISLDDLRHERREHRALIESLTQDRPQKAAIFNARINNVVAGAQRKTAEALSGKSQERKGIRDQQHDAVREEWRDAKPLLSLEDISTNGTERAIPIPITPEPDHTTEATSDYDLIFKHARSALNQM